MAGDWVESLLQDVIEIKHGFAFSGEYFRDEPPGDVLLTPGNFAIGGGFKGEKFKYYDGPVPVEFVLQEGDLLVTMTDLSKQADTLGYSAFVPAPIVNRRYLHNQRLGKIVVKDKRAVDPRYLHYLMQTHAYRHEVLASATGTTVKHTSPERIKRFRFMRPSISEQRAIAHILGTLDDKIELNRRMNETLEAMARTIFKSWFVDFDPVHAKSEGRRPTGMDATTAALFPDSFQDSPLGKIPKGWLISSLSEVAHVIDCLHSKKPERQECGCIFLQVYNIGEKGHLDLSNPFYITEDDYREWASRIEMTSGDLVITKTGRVGAVAQIPSGLRTALGRNIVGIRANPKYVLPRFLRDCMLSDAMRQEIDSRTHSGTILQSLHVKEIEKLRFVIPPIELVRKYEELANPLHAYAERNESESRTLAAIRDTLLPKLLSGKIRVQDAEKIVEAAA